MVTGKTVLTTAKKFIDDGGLKFCKEYGYATIVNWCVIFIWYVYKKSNASKYLYNGNKVNNAGVLHDWLKRNAKSIKINNAKPGDIVIMTWDGKTRNHAGIAVKGYAKRIKTIEGNTGSIDPRVTKVCFKERNKDAVLGIYRVIPEQNSKKIDKNINLDQMVKDVLIGKIGKGKKCKNALGEHYDVVIKKVNKIEKLTAETIRGKYGNGDARKLALGSDYKLVQWNINRIKGDKK